MDNLGVIDDISLAELIEMQLMLHPGITDFSRLDRLRVETVLETHRISPLDALEDADSAGIPDFDVLLGEPTLQYDAVFTEPHVDVRNEDWLRSALK